MHTTEIKSKVFFKHAPEEVQELSQAIIPLAPHISAVTRGHERRYLKHILSGKYFTGRDASLAKSMLLRAAKHARNHLEDYFPLMRAEVLESVTFLEQATARYWRMFQAKKADTVPAE